MQVSYEPGDRIVVDGQLLEVVVKANNRWGGFTYKLGELVPGGEPPRKRWLTARLASSKAGVIDRQAIRDMVYAFYGRVRRDPELSPVFEARLAERWDPHLEKMVSFWSSVLLAEGSFSGDPMGKHRAIAEGEPAHFARWLTLFRETLAEVFTEPCAELVESRAKAMARGLSTGMFGVPFDVALRHAQS